MVLFQVRTGFGGAALSPPSRPWKGPKPDRSPRLPRQLTLQSTGSEHPGPARLCAHPGGPAPELTFRGAGTPRASPCCCHMALMVCAWVPATGLSGQGDVSPRHLGDGGAGRGRGSREDAGCRGGEGAPSNPAPPPPLPASPVSTACLPSCFSPNTLCFAPHHDPPGPTGQSPRHRGPALSGPWVTGLKPHLSKSCHPTTE